MAKRPGARVRGSETGRPIMVLFDVLGQRWTLRILWELRGDTRLTFRDLRARCDDVSPTLLNRRLRELRDLRLLDHTEAGYGATSWGRQLGVHLVRLSTWSARWVEGIEK